MTKKEMELYFNIELRDLVRTNQVKSLMIWYAGHENTLMTLVTGYQWMRNEMRSSLILILIF